MAENILVGDMEANKLIGLIKLVVANELFVRQIEQRLCEVEGDVSRIWDNVTHIEDRMWDTEVKVEVEIEPRVEQIETKLEIEQRFVPAHYEARLRLLAARLNP